MAKSKRGGPALFELLQGNRFRKDDPEIQTHLRVVHHEPDAAEEPAIEAKVPAMAGSQKPATVLIHEDRVHLSLTPVTAAVSVFGISILILGVYLIGRDRGEKAGVVLGMSQALDPAAQSGQTLEEARNQPPATHLVESLLEGGSKAAPRARESSRTRGAEAPAAPAEAVELPPGPRQGWARDYTYIVTQEFGAGRMEDASRARDFLAAKGFPAEIVKLESGGLQLITLEGYNHKDAGQKRKADDILKKQRAAGAEYFASGGGYKLEGYYKTLKKDQW